uniref:Aminopeptidase n=1 Tax=Strigamia maritima TaxID=126957 RepID=T1JIK8_STRMM
MDDRRKCMILAILCLVLATIVIALTSALAAKSTFPPEPQKQTQPQSSTAEQTSTSHSYSTTPTPAALLPWQQIRLPREVVPYHYDIHLIPDFVEGSFKGIVDIHIRVLSSTDHVIVHFAYLNVTIVTLKNSETSDEVKPLNYFVYEQNEVLVVESSSRTLSTGNYTLHVEYKGSLVDSLVGFYRSSYVDTITNSTRYMAASKFEPTYARRAFPCFDEPALKATFRIQLTHQPQMTALSNMNVESKSPSKILPGSTETTFNTSVTMSTYLVVFVISEFNYTETLTSSKKPFRVYSRPDQINSTHYALDVGVHILNYYEQYFNISYPLPKQDLIGIPDFVTGAMENWGLITFYETVLLYDEKNVASSKKRNIARTTAHELTHQWFGNLVTMDWWDDLWLNEGFATFFAYEGMAQLDELNWKNWRKSADFLLDNLHPSLQHDSSLSSHPIIQPVHHPDEITSIFDLISYSKGASVIRMLEAFIGQDLFKKGLHKYLNRFAYSNAKTQDLWDVMSSENPSINVTKVMDTWTKQMGYPVVYVEKQGNKFIANQTRFLEDITLTPDESESPYNYLWEIPLTYKQGINGQVKTQWMHMERQISWEDTLPQDEIIKFNVDQTGVYRVNYHINMWNRLANATCGNLSVSGLSMADITNLIDDSFSLFYNGMLTPAIFFKFCTCLSKQDHYETWSVISNGLGSISNLLENSPAFSLLRKFSLNLVTPMYEKVNWTDNGTYRQKRLQGIILDDTCALDYAPCLEEAYTRLVQWLKDSNSVAADLQGVVFMYGLRGAGANSALLWEEIWSRYLIEPSPQIKNNLLDCLATTSRPWLLKRLLESIFNESEIRSQSAIKVISSVSANPVGELIAWNFYRANWERLVNKLTLNDRNLGKLIKSLTSGFTTEISLLEMMDFFRKYPEAGAGTRPRLQATEQVKANIKWIELRQKELIAQLQKT